MSAPRLPASDRRSGPVVGHDGEASGVRSHGAAPPGPVAEPEPTAPVVGGPWARWKARTTGGAPLFPLGALFGLNMVDELDAAAFGVLLPEIRDHFGLDLRGVLTVVSLASVAALVLTVPIGFYADRFKRVPIAAGGASMWGLFSMLTGLAATVWMLGVARAGSGIGKAVNSPVHNSLLPDYYDVPVRPRVYALHRYASSLGQFLGPIAAGLLAFSFGWRTPFVVFAVATAVFVVVALRLREPVRGRFERHAAGVSDEVAATEEQPPSWAESWRLLWQVRTLRRIYFALPFLALSLTGLDTLTALLYAEVFGLDERGRGVLVGGITGVAALVGFLVGIPVVMKLSGRDPGLALRAMVVVTGLITGTWVVFALAPTLGVAIAANAFLGVWAFLVIPSIFAVLSLAVPSKIRAFGFAAGALWALPGLMLLPIVGAIADAHGIRTGMLIAAPVFVVGGLIVASASGFAAQDIGRVWQAAAVRSELVHLRRQGKVKLLLARGVTVHYDGVQVLFGVDVEVDEGEIVALLGTNGAGKSTLLRAISGLVEPSGGVIFFDGRDLTHTPPDEVAGRGITQVPGGQGVFTQLSVVDNLRLAAWLQRRHPADVKAAIGRVWEIFPELARRRGEPAGNLSGGQQQMLTLAMALVERPRLLMIDELSLGLAPTVVAQLLAMVRALRDQGVTIILVEQSVNVALSVAERAYFLEKGEVRFHGPTRALLDRPDLLRSVFLSTAHQTMSSPQSGPASRTGPVVAPSGTEGNGARPEGAAAAPTDRVAAAQGDEVQEVVSGVAASAGEAPPAGGTQPAVLEVREVAKSFGGVRALDDVSFDVRPREILGFIGPNGAGKTTLFDVISGFLPAEGGCVRLRADGTVIDLTRLSTHRRAHEGLGRSFQDGRLFPGLSVAETLAVALDQHVAVRDPVAASLRLPTVRDSEQQVRLAVDELVELLGLGAYRDKFVRELSTGTRRIVDLACVLAQAPQVVLLDEPSSGIAQREAEALGPVLRRVRDELGAALLVIEHDLPLLMAIADRMIALDLGRIVTTGRPAEVVDHPAVVASYLGTDQAAAARSGTAPPG